MCEFQVINAKHDDVVSDRHSVGLAIDVGNAILFYTGDTGWNKDIEDTYKKFMDNKWSNKEIILLSHIGGFKEYEKKYVIGNEREKSFYKNHLGRLGLVKVNELLKPKICIISEFGEEFREHRVKLAEILAKAFNNTIFFAPADIGLEYDFHEMKFSGITNIDTEKKDLTFSLVDTKDMAVCMLRKDYSLHYFKKNNGFSESDLIQVLIDKYDMSIK